MCQDDAVALLAFRFASIRHHFPRNQRIADVDRFEKALIDTENGPPPSINLHAQPEHRAEKEQRITTVRGWPSDCARSLKYNGQNDNVEW